MLAPIGGVAPYGFQFIAGRRAWHQGEQETLAAIIEHRRAGLSWAKVADKLSATGHRTRTGGQWTRTCPRFRFCRGTWNGYRAFRRWRRAGTARRLRTGHRWRHRA